MSCRPPREGGGEKSFGRRQSRCRSTSAPSLIHWGVGLGEEFGQLWKRTEAGVEEKESGGCEAA